MKKKLTIAGIVVVVLAVIIGVTALAMNQGKSSSLSIAIEGELSQDTVIEYTGEGIQFPMAHVEDGSGQIVSYDVNYEVVNLGDNSTLEDKYAFFDLKSGSYKFICTYAKDTTLKTEMPFQIQDTTAPVIEFTEVPNGLFIQDIEEGEVQKLPTYTLADASEDEGIDLVKTLYFKGEKDNDYKECTFREINNSYEVTEFGKFKYSLTATDAYGNSSTQEVEWKIKDRDWKPSEPLADYASEGYTNYVEAGDANQYYVIGNDYADEWLEEYEGAKGVMKIDMGFNNAAGYGNNTLRLYFANSFSQKDIEGKYLAVRIRVDAEHLRNEFLFAGNNVAMREEGSMRAFHSIIQDPEFGEWKTYYIDAATVQTIGVYPNATYNSNTTFYEGGEPATCLQLCFSREAGYYNDMTLYIDSISLAEKLPDTEITISGNTASWTAVEKAAGYKVDINGEESVITDTKITLPGEKGCITVTPLGDGALTLDAEECTAVYGIDPGDKLAAYDDELYLQLFTDKLKFSTEAENAGYRAKSLTSTLTEEGVTVELGTGDWGVVTGIRTLFPVARAKGSNTTLLMNLCISHAKYGTMRVFDYDGEFLASIELNAENTGKYYEFQVDLAAYDKPLKGVQLIFGPHNMQVVSEGVTIQFKEMKLANTYYDITVNGETLTCVGEKDMVVHYINENAVQFSNFYNFGVPADDTKLSFEGTIMLDGKPLKASAVNVVGYKDSDTICFKVPHKGKTLTIMKGSIIYYNGKAAIVKETVNGKWNGNTNGSESWIASAEIPATPPDEYVTAGGKQLLVENKLALEPGYSADGVVQFTDVNDFGVPEDDTKLSFEGTILLDGAKVNNINFVGYKDNMTIGLKIPHNGKLLTIMKDSILYYGDKAVVITETFNARWNGKDWGWEAWDKVAEIPAIPKDEYVKAGGKKRLVAGKLELTPGYSADGVVQFTDVCDFGVSEDDTKLSFEGTILLDGAKVNSINLVGYKESATIGLKVPHNGKVLTIMKDSIIYYGEKAIIVTKTFNAKWNGKDWGWEAWDVVSKIPEIPEDEYIKVGGKKCLVVNKLELTPGYSADGVVQFLDVNDFGVSEDDTKLSFEGTILLDGVKVNSINLVGYKGSTTIGLKIPHNGKTLTIMKDSVIYYGKKAVVITKTFNAKWNGKDFGWDAWKKISKVPEIKEDEYVTVGGKKYLVVNKLELTPGYSAKDVVQFVDVNDFGVKEDDTPLSFEGTILLDGTKVESIKMVGYKDGNTTIGLKVPHNGKILTIMKDSIIYYGDKAVVITKTFNAKWNGKDWGWEAWKKISKVPEVKEDEYITIGDKKYRVVNKLELTPGYSGKGVVQFVDVNDFGAKEDDTPLFFEGTILLDGAKVENVNLVGYKDGNTTIGLKIPHNGKILTIMKDSVIYYGDKAVVITKTFNAKWNGKDWGWEAWDKISKIPEVKEDEYVEIGGEKKLIVNKVSLTDGYTADTLVQFLDVYDFKVPEDNTELSFEGTILLDGVIQNPVQFIGYKDNTIICLNEIAHKGKLLTIMGGSYVYYGDKAVLITETFNAKWNGKTWDKVAEVPEPVEPPEQTEISFLAYSHGGNNLIQVKTDIPADTPVVNFTTDENGCSITQGGTGGYEIGWVGMDKGSDNRIYLTFHFNDTDTFNKGQTYSLKQGSVFGFTNGKCYTLDKDYTFTYQGGTTWDMAATAAASGTAKIKEGGEGNFTLAGIMQTMQEFTKKRFVLAYLGSGIYGY